MNKFTKLVYKWFDKILPPIRFNLNKKKKKRDPIVTEEDMDRWATEFLEKLEHERRTKRGTRN